jgi:hypothetical protein
MSVDLMDLAAKGVVRLAVLLPRPVRNRLILILLYRGKPPKGWL